MATCTVHGNSIGKNQGPGFLEAKLACDDINEANANWNVTFDHKEYQTVFTATPGGGVAVSDAQLKSALQAQLPDHYFFS